MKLSIGSCIIWGVVIKWLCYPLYYSTDLAVHHYWIVLTGHLPWTEWYVDQAHIGTLDYPPLFALFQLLLFWMLQGMQKIVGFSPPTTLALSWQHALEELLTFPPVAPLPPLAIYLLRSTVVLSDFLYLYALYRYISQEYRASSGKISQQGWVAFAMAYLNAGLLIVDHIHFQYNGYLMGLLVWAITLTKNKQYLFGAVMWCILACSKHLFLGCAPLVSVYIFSNYCCEGRRFHPLRTLALMLVGASVFGVVLGPFIQEGQVSALVGRMFPFQRGLCHAYWAPNVWALYTAADKILAKALPRLGYSSLVDNTVVSNFASGQVGVFHHQVLPQISPRLCIALFVVSLLPSFVRAWRSKPSFDWTAHVARCLFLMFFWGYHVHEKAIIPVVILFGLCVLHSPVNKERYVVFSLFANYSLAPLLFTVDAVFVGDLLLLTYHWLLMFVLKVSWTWTQVMCVLLVVLLETFRLGYHLVVPGLPFLPLMLISITCSIAYILTALRWEDQPRKPKTKSQ